MSKKMVKCIHTTNAPHGVKLIEGQSYVVEESKHDEFYKVFINGMAVDLLKARFTDITVNVSREIEVEPLSDDEELTSTKRYKTTSGKQLFKVLEEDMLTPDEYRGFLKGNVYKYMHRYKAKGGLKDLKKAQVYLKELEAFEEEQENA